MNRRHVGPTVIVVLVTIACTAPPVSGQRVRKSQRGTVTQTVGDTEVSLRYFRPAARGRMLFGNLVEYDREWTPGADSATTIEFSNGVSLGGKPLAAGRYSIWVIPREGEAWTLILSSAADVWHKPYRDGKEVLNVDLEPREGEHMETLAFYFPVVGPDSARINLHWGTTILEVPIRLN